MSIQSYKAKHFVIQELVPSQVYTERGAKAWQLIDERLIKNMDALRDALGFPVTCNNWHTGGKRTQSGLRIVSQKHWSPYSLHPFGKASDTICEMPAHLIRRKIKSGKIILPYPACFELGVSWLHMDVRNFNNKGQHYFFYP